MIRLVEDKGVQHLIQAFVKLSSKYSNIELWIVGDGAYREELERLAAGHKRIRFWGRRADQSTFLASFDIFVQPALHEGWGRNVKEAMYFGLPVVGSKTGGITLQIQHGKTGVLFNPGDTTKLAKHLETLLDQPRLRLQLGKNAAIKAREDGDFKVLVQQKLVPEFTALVRGLS